MSSSRRVQLHVFDVVDSTNRTVLAAGARGDPEGTTHLAREQTHGRGREERAWCSPRDAGLWMSTLLRPACDASRWPGLALVAGAAVWDALAALPVRNVSLYWPNDLQIGRRKLGGILCQSSWDGAAGWVALGVGINLDLRHPRAASAVPAALRPRVISLAEATGADSPEPARLALEILSHFWPLYDRFVAGSTPREVVGNRLAHVGRDVRVRGDATRRFDGRIEGLTDEGHLLVRGEWVETHRAEGNTHPSCRGVLPTQEDGVVAVVSGDVEYVE